ncbi:MAG: hypothetical protein R3212_11060, partial [Xanthomonadales bacterium]|nr:hypothetical protein [Xanthomonadales bacterium]
PQDRLPAVASFFELGDEAQIITERFPEVSSGYSKRPDKRYTPGTRAQLLQLARNEQADAIRTGLDWATTLIDSHPALSAVAEFLE